MSPSVCCSGLVPCWTWPGDICSGLCFPPAVWQVLNNTETLVRIISSFQIGGKNQTKLDQDKPKQKNPRLNSTRLNYSLKSFQRAEASNSQPVAVPLRTGLFPSFSSLPSCSPHCFLLFTSSLPFFPPIFFPGSWEQSFLKLLRISYSLAPKPLTCWNYGCIAPNRV